MGAVMMRVEGSIDAATLGQVLRHLHLPMIGLPVGTRIWIAASITDMRCGFNGLAAKVEIESPEDPFSAMFLCFLGVAATSSYCYGLAISKGLCLAGQASGARP